MIKLSLWFKDKISQRARDPEGPKKGKSAKLFKRFRSGANFITRIANPWNKPLTE